ncbi:hypothetical protein CANARDRAFT_176428 [[Candida] arabinofermentans NRRL YB-2248]|uniref:Endonuclease/exonuclease/phosphatase domain-containing protein n=1 Tax=[Candida] arabinofermentans NRRL YB-2248 TaxID=983967 RepID=A0A1E4SZU3_9ASCO|nr:hypothetical protein CANARDRAFT_176428 [[Candida] arabinofermentans NRRL YB-2248]
MEELSEGNSNSNSFKSADTLKLLTFNTWGLKFVSKCRKERLTAISDKLASSSTDYDIVALQEIWTQEDWEYMDEVCSEKYPYRRWFSSGILTGPGLAVLSKVPIKKTFLYRFPINGRPSAFFRGDWYVGKSVAVTLLEPSFENASPIAILNSHMHAPYSLTGDAAYACHRACQAWDISTIVTQLTEAGYAVILVGDLNSRPGSLPYRILQHEGKLEDSWEALNGASDLEQIKLMDPVQQIKKAATTCDSTLNTWRASRQPHEACRLDYALIDTNRLKPVAASVDFTEQIENYGSYSDHFAYSATFKVLPKFNGDSSSETIFETKEKLRIYYDLKETVLEYIRDTNAWQSKWRNWHFILSILLFIAFLPVITVVSFIAPWASILFFFFGVLSTVFGVVDGLIGFLFGRNEYRALKEVALQIDDRVRYMERKGM